MSLTFQKLIPSEKDVCGICLSPTQVSEEIVGHKYGSPLPKGQHEFHHSCIRLWFEQGNYICPSCISMVSNGKDYLFPEWKKACKLAPIIFKRGILAAITSAAIREIIPIFLPEKTAIKISIIAASAISLIKFPSAENIMGPLMGTMIINQVPMLEFKKIAILPILGLTRLPAIMLLKEDIQAGIINVITTGISTGITALTTQIARTIIHSLVDFTIK